MAIRAHTVSKFYLSGFLAPESEGIRGREPFVWVGSLTTGKIKARAPKNISTVRGLYDGRGALAEPDKTIEDHLAEIEFAASMAIRKFAAARITEVNSIPLEISRFLAWQAARSPAYMELSQRWVNEPSSFGLDTAEGPPPLDTHENVNHGMHPILLEDPNTGLRREVMTWSEIDRYRRQGWRVIFCRDDHLQLLHLQAWEFQTRHFPRFSWIAIQPPSGQFFITSDRGVAWIVDGFADAPPAALWHAKAEIVAPLTRTLALVGRLKTGALNVAPREVNRFVACAASGWIAGSTRDVIRQALIDRSFAT
jgi:hypothetical protein